MSRPKVFLSAEFDWDIQNSLHVSFGLRVYIVDAKNGIFAIFYALAISKNAIFSDISGRTLMIIPQAFLTLLPVNVLDKDRIFLPNTAGKTKSRKFSRIPKFRKKKKPNSDGIIDTRSFHRMEHKVQEDLSARRCQVTFRWNLRFRCRKVPCPSNLYNQFAWSKAASSFPELCIVSKILKNFEASYLKNWFYGLGTFLHQEFSELRTLGVNSENGIF